MKTKRIISIGIVSSLILLTSCASYHASPLCNPSPNLIQMSSKDDELLIVSQAFSKNDCYRFLDRDVLSEGYQPVQIYIQNDSNKSYLFSLNRISLPTARPEEVAETVHTSTVGRAAGYGAGALIFWPLAIPAVVDGVKSANANKALDSDFAAKAAKDQMIPPHSRFNAIIFVPVNGYQRSYSITLMDQDTNQPKTFNVMNG